MAAMGESRGPDGKENAFVDLKDRMMVRSVADFFTVR